MSEIKKIYNGFYNKNYFIVAKRISSEYNNYSFWRFYVFNKKKFLFFSYNEYVGGWGYNADFNNGEDLDKYMSGECVSRLHKIYLFS